MTITKKLARLALLAALTLPLAAAAGEKFSADAHQAKGVSCADCHGKAKKKTFVEAERCLSCHGPGEALAAKTAAVKPENPHASPHWGAQMECNVCHRQHKATQNWCDHCHRFGFKVP
ncbi:MAG: cytochrome c3 family protein [Anaeromyxobacter sp.]